LAKLHSHHYPGLRGYVYGAEAAFKKFRNYSQTYLTLKSSLLDVGKVLL